MLCSCTHMATVGVKGLTQVLSVQWTGPSLLMTTAYVYAIMPLQDRQLIARGSLIGIGYLIYGV